MKKFFITLFIGLFICNTSIGKSKSMGKGPLNLSEGTINHFITYIKSKSEGTPHIFLLGHVSDKEQYTHYWFCPGTTDNCRFANIGQFISTCEKAAKKRHNKNIKCNIFAKKRKIVWDNGINPGKGKRSLVKKKWTRQEYIAKFTELGFFGDDTSLNTTSSSVLNNNKLIKKNVKKYELKGERSIALSWDGYSNLIAGTVEFDETDYKGILNIPLPNNDGNCEGSYSLQQNGKGTWQISCTNNMGAAGTLKWIRNGGVTGAGRDHNDKKVKFTVSKKG